jgi:dolichol-phosphate mannosyltransferase
LSGRGGPFLVSEAHSETVRLSVVIPTYNESQNVDAIVKRLAAALDPVLHGRYELIVVDDNSPDRTWERAGLLTADHPQLRVIRRDGEKGLSTAVIRGWQAASGEVLAVIDSDLQHPPELITELWAQIDNIFEQYP